MQRTRPLLLTLTAALLLVGAGCSYGGRTALPLERADGDATTPVSPGVPTEATAPSAIESAAEATKDEPPTAQPQDSTNPTTMYEVPKAFPGILPDAELKGKDVRITTSKGDIVFEVLADEAPKAASNMIALARSGFYDGLTFHRVVANFVIQGGDPTGNGSGGPGYRFEDEPVSLDYKRGIVAMANAGPDTNGSQFFIVLKDQPNLPKLYTVFGRVVSGMDVVDKIVVGDVMTKVIVEDRR